MNTLFKILILILLSIDLFNYYIKEQSHILNIVLDLERGNYLIYLYDAILFSISIIGIRNNVKFLPLISLLAELSMKICAIKLKGLKYLKEEYASFLESNLFLTMLIILLDLFDRLTQRISKRGVIEYHFHYNKKEINQ